MFGKVTETSWLLEEIDLSVDPIEEAEVGRKLFGSKGLCKIYVNNGEGPLPHFHLESKDKKTDICICIYSPHYFDHGKHTGSLNSQQREILDKWLREPDEEMKVSRWNVIEYLWFLNNPQYNNPKFRPPVAQRIQPDYTKLKSFRSN